MLPVNRINWKITNKIVLSVKTIDSALLITHHQFLNSHTNPFSNYKYFNICTSWNINGCNSDKRDGLSYFNSILNLCLFAFKKLVTIIFKLLYHPIFFLRSIQIIIESCWFEHLSGMRGLYIRVHTCLFISDPFEYKYIISTNLLSLWSVKCLLEIFIFLQNFMRNQEGMLYLIFLID